MRPIYLDYNATTPVDPNVVRAMLPFLQDAGDGLGDFGNPSSAHVYGRRSHDAVDKARAQVAELIGAHSEEIVFTSGGTEASNHALKGVAFANLGSLSRRALEDLHIITCAVAHPAT